LTPDPTVLTIVTPALPSEGRRRNALRKKWEFGEVAWVPLADTRRTYDRGCRTRLATRQ